MHQPQRLCPEVTVTGQQLAAGRFLSGTVAAGPRTFTKFTKLLSHPLHHPALPTPFPCGGKDSGSAPNGW